MIQPRPNPFDPYGENDMSTIVRPPINTPVKPMPGIRPRADTVPRGGGIKPIPVRPPIRIPIMKPPVRQGRVTGMSNDTGAILPPPILPPDMSPGHLGGGFGFGDPPLLPPDMSPGHLGPMQMGGAGMMMPVLGMSAYSPIRFAKHGGKFRPGDQVVVGDGSGPELVTVHEDGIEVTPNPEDVTPGKPPVIADQGTPPIDRHLEGAPAVGPRPAEIPAAGAQPDDPVVDTDPVTPAQPMMMSARDRYERKRGEVGALRDAPIKSTSRLKSGGAAALLAMGNAFSRRPIRDWSDFAQAGAETGTYLVGGMIDKKLGPQMRHDLQVQRAEGELANEQGVYEDDIKHRKSEADINNSEMRPIFEQQKADLAKSKLVAKVQGDELAFQRKMELVHEKAKVEGGKWDIFVDENTGQVLKRFKNDASRAPEPFVDEDGKQLFKPSEQVYDYNDPLTNMAVKVKGRDVLQTGVGIVQANANREDAASRFNADAQNKYQRDIDDYNSKYGDMIAKNTAALNLAGDSQKDLDMLTQQVQGQGYPATAQQQTELGRLREAVRNNRSKADEYLTGAKTLTRPEAPKTYQSTQVTGSGGKYSGRSFKSPADLRQYFPGKSDEEIRRKVEANGGKFEK